MTPTHAPLPLSFVLCPENGCCVLPPPGNLHQIRVLPTTYQISLQVHELWQQPCKANQSICSRALLFLAVVLTSPSSSPVRGSLRLKLRWPFCSGRVLNVDVVCNTLLLLTLRVDVISEISSRAASWDVNFVSDFPFDLPSPSRCC